MIDHLPRCHIQEIGFYYNLCKCQLIKQETQAAQTMYYMSTDTNNVPEESTSI